MNVANRTRRILGPAALALLTLAAPSLAAAPKKTAPAPTRITPAVPNTASGKIPTGLDSVLVNDLKQGGYVIFFRHAMTNWNERDGAEGDFSDRHNQRNLSEAGQRAASAIGQSLRALEIPIGKVLASPMWRTRDTAEFAFGAYDTTSLLFWKGPKFREARIKMLSTPPEAGTNLILVGHQDQIIPLVTGLKRDQLQEGDALIFHPLGSGKYRLVRQVTPMEWAVLAGVESPTDVPAPPAGSMPAGPDSLRGSKAGGVN